MPGVRLRGRGGRHSREQRHLGLTEPAIMQRVQGEVVPAQDVSPSSSELVRAWVFMLVLL